MRPHEHVHTHTTPVKGRDGCGSAAAESINASPPSLSPTAPAIELLPNATNSGSSTIGSSDRIKGNASETGHAAAAIPSSVLCAGFCHDRGTVEEPAERPISSATSSHHHRQQQQQQQTHTQEDSSRARDSSSGGGGSDLWGRGRTRAFLLGIYRLAYLGVIPLRLTYDVESKRSSINSNSARASGNVSTNGEGNSKCHCENSGVACNHSLLRIGSQPSGRTTGEETERVVEVNATTETEATMTLVGRHEGRLVIFSSNGFPCCDSEENRSDPSGAFSDDAIDSVADFPLQRRFCHMNVLTDVSQLPGLLPDAADRRVRSHCQQREVNNHATSERSKDGERDHGGEPGGSCEVLPAEGCSPLKRQGGEGADQQRSAGSTRSEHENSGTVSESSNRHVSCTSPEADGEGAHTLQAMAEIMRRYMKEYDSRVRAVAAPSPLSPPPLLSTAQQRMAAMPITRLLDGAWAAALQSFADSLAWGRTCTNKNSNSNSNSNSADGGSGGNSTRQDNLSDDGGGLWKGTDSTGVAQQRLSPAAIDTAKALVAALQAHHRNPLEDFGPVFGQLGCGGTVGHDYLEHLDILRRRQRLRRDQVQSPPQRQQQRQEEGEGEEEQQCRTEIQMADDEMHALPSVLVAASGSPYLTTAAATANDSFCCPSSGRTASAVRWGETPYGISRPMRSPAQSLQTSRAAATTADVAVVGLLPDAAHDRVEAGRGWRGQWLFEAPPPLSWNPRAWRSLCGSSPSSGGENGDHANTAVLLQVLRRELLPGSGTSGTFSEAHDPQLRQAWDALESFVRIVVVAVAAAPAAAETALCVERSTGPGLSERSSARAAAAAAAAVSPPPAAAASVAAAVPRRLTYSSDDDDDRGGGGGGGKQNEAEVRVEKDTGEGGSPLYTAPEQQQQAENSSSPSPLSPPELAYARYLVAEVSALALRQCCLTLAPAREGPEDGFSQGAAGPQPPEQQRRYRVCRDDELEALPVGVQHFASERTAAGEVVVVRTMPPPSVGASAGACDSPLALLAGGSGAPRALRRRSWRWRWWWLYGRRGWQQQQQQPCQEARVDAGEEGGGGWRFSKYARRLRRYFTGH